MRLVSAVSAVLALALLSPLAVLAQDAPLAPALSVPRLVNFSGVFQPANGQPSAPVEAVTLSIYAEQDGGLPLWQEMQTVTVETTGRFTVLLGASHPDGLPPAVDECPNCLTRGFGVFSKCASPVLDHTRGLPMQFGVAARAARRGLDCPKA